MFRFIAEILVRSRIEKENLARRKQFLPWDKIEKIALIIDKQEALNKSALDKFIEDSKKFVEVFYVELNSKQPTYADWQCFSKKDASWLKLPKSSIAESLKKKKFDLVINAAHERELFSTAVCAVLPAAFKCGSSDKFNDVGLIIKRKESFQLLDYLNDTLRYLKMIRV
jgi:hypothetical protein